jgi:hypothetical protein
MNYNDEFYHHGIKGMKWGVRRYQKKNGGLTALGKKLRKAANKYQKEKKQKAEAKKAIEAKANRTVKDMSDKELTDVIRRLEMEKKYKELNPAQVSKGKRFMDTMLNNVISPAAEDVAKQLAKSYMVDAVNKMFKLPDDLKVYTNNKKK